jgi:hypothetical protein
MSIFIQDSCSRFLRHGRRWLGRCDSGILQYLGISYLRISLAYGSNCFDDEMHFRVC